MKSWSCAHKYKYQRFLALPSALSLPCLHKLLPAIFPTFPDHFSSFKYQIITMSQGFDRSKWPSLAKAIDSDSDVEARIHLPICCPIADTSSPTMAVNKSFSPPLSSPRLSRITKTILLLFSQLSTSSRSKRIFSSVLDPRKRPFFRRWSRNTNLESWSSWEGTLGIRPFFLQRQ